MELDRSRTIKQFRYLPGDQTIDSENIDVFDCLKMQKSKRGIGGTQRQFSENYLFGKRFEI